MDELTAVSWNIRGVRKQEKKRAVRSLVNRTKTKVLFLQEVKLRSLKSTTVKRIWGKSEVEYIYAPADGSSGGVLSEWDLNYFRKVKEVIGSNFIIVIGQIISLNSHCAMINVYCPNDPHKRADLFAVLLDQLQLLQVPCLIGGDFNVILDPAEKIGGDASPSEIETFASFIEAAELIDLPLVGGKFTWSNNREVATWCRLDRFLVSPGFAEQFPGITQELMPRLLSDHNPIIITVPREDWGPTPFRFYNSWLDDSDCKAIIEKTCRERKGMGIKGLLKSVKAGLRNWRKTMASTGKETARSVEEKINELELEMQTDPHNSEKQLKVATLRGKLWSLYIKEERDWLQKSRLRWFRVGDKNTKFFHIVASGRRAKNAVKSIKVHDDIVTSPADVKKVVRAHFVDLYSRKENFEVEDFGCNFPRLNEADASMLEDQFTEKEIFDAIRASDGNKAPDPDWLNFNFFKFFWKDLKGEICAVINNFYETGSWDPGLNHAFLTLIPKVLGSSNLNDLRPISLVGGVYKIISKVLASRLAKCINNLIGEQQFAFAAGRQILDCSFIANEIIDAVRKKGSQAIVFKADFRKAYDSVDWKFLDFVMRSMGFGNRWRKWIMSLVTTASLSVIVNGSSTERFHMGRGLRQGCSLSPLLFNLVSEALSLMIKKAVSVGLFTGVGVGGGDFGVSHLQFADDLILFCEADLSQVQNIRRMLRCFELISGLKLNLAKSKIFGINIDQGILESWAAEVGCGAESFPTNYLGMPLGVTRNYVALWHPVVARVKKRLSTWKTRFLSIAGRLTLLKSVLQALPIYFMSIIRMPILVVREMESCFSKFLWGTCDKRGVHWVGWENCCKPKLAGGLGLTNLQVQNEGLLNKWVWRYGTESGSLWKRLVSQKYENGVEEVMPRKFEGRIMSWQWREIMKSVNGEDRTGGLFASNLRIAVGNGHATRFWEDPWAGPVALKDSFPRVFSLALQKSGTISKFGSKVNGIWNWDIKLRRAMFDWEIEQWDLFIATLRRVTVGEDFHDFLRWDGSTSGNYSPSGFKKLVHTQMFQVHNFWENIWKGIVPPKVEIFLWQLALGRIPTRAELVKRLSISATLDTCPFCFTNSETVSHLMFQCKSSWLIWMRCCGLWNVHLVVPENTKQLIECWADARPSCISNDIWLLILGAIAWSLWLYRNSIIFEGKTFDAEELVKLIRIRIGSWMKAKWPGQPWTMGDFVLDPTAAIAAPNVSSKIKLVRWNPPPVGSLKFNVDGAVCRLSGMGGVGGILRNEAGRSLLVFSKNIGVTDVSVAEALAVKEALLIFSASKWKGSNLIIESDCSTIVEWFTNVPEAPRFVKEILCDIKCDAAKWWKIALVPRTINGTADRLAKSGINRDEDLLFLG